MRNDRNRIFRQEIKKLFPKKVKISTLSTGSFCKLGRVFGVKGGVSFSPNTRIVIPVNGNPNDNRKI